MHTTRVIIAGCGDVGSALGLQLIAEGATVYGLRRTINQLPGPIQPLAADLAQPETLAGLPDCDYLVYCAAAKSRNPEIYRRTYVDGLRNLLKAMTTPPRRLFLTSSTGVYAQHQHEWVDETSPTEPASDTGRILLQSEAVALAAACPASIVRFSGIYGPGRNHLLSQVQQGIGAPATPIHYSNRIHRDDCASVLAHLIRLDRQGVALADHYLASDDAPAPLSEVTDWLAGEMGVAPTQRQSSRQGGSKRCCNARLKQTGFRFRYPDYRSGYRALLDAQRPD